MLAQLRLNKKILITLFFPMSVYAQTSPLDQYRSGATTHGLYEINEDVKKFLQVENEKTNAHWKSSGPNLKYGVPLCLEPLKISWVPKKYGRFGPAVFVDCFKSIDPSYSPRDWQMIINVYDSSEPKKKH